MIKSWRILQWVSRFPPFSRYLISHTEEWKLTLFLESERSLSGKSATRRQQELQRSHQPAVSPAPQPLRLIPGDGRGAEVGDRRSKDRSDLGFCLLRAGNPGQHAIQQDLLKAQTRSKADLSKAVSHGASQWALVPHHYVLIKLSYSSAKTHKSQGFTQSGFCHCN